MLGFPVLGGSALGLHFIRDQVNHGLNFVRHNNHPVLSVLSNLSQVVVRGVAQFVQFVKPYLKMVMDKLFSALDFMGSWARKLGAKLLGAFQRYGGCLRTELDAHRAAREAGLTLVAGLDIKMTPSLTFVCNRGSCYHCMGTIGRQMFLKVAHDIQGATSLAQLEIEESLCRLGVC